MIGCRVIRRGRGAGRGGREFDLCDWAFAIVPCYVEKVEIILHSVVSNECKCFT